MRQTASALLTVSLLTFFTACSETPKPRAESGVPVYQSTPESAKPLAPSVAIAPNLNEVQNKIKTVFKGAAELNPNHNPNFFSGDFNGDNSKDLVVILKPVNLEEMNRQFAPWLLRDPRANTSTKVRPTIEKDDTLLAVIHGFGNNDWRDPDATQTFVLKNVVGNDLKVETGKEFVEANTGRRLPRPQGDLIGETINGARGYIYYATSNYSWYDPKTYKEDDPSAGVFHRARMK